MIDLFGYEKKERPSDYFKTGALKFVLTLHRASKLHHDLRIQVQNELVSFAFYPTDFLDPKIKTEMTKVNNHALSSYSAEGTIVEGKGMGEIIVWDRGEYYHIDSNNRKESENQVRNGLYAGNLRLCFRGQRMMGHFRLVRKSKDSPKWFLIKEDDEFANILNPLKINTSILTGMPIQFYSIHRSEQI